MGAQPEETATGPCLDPPHCASCGRPAAVCEDMHAGYYRENGEFVCCECWGDYVAAGLAEPEPAPAAGVPDALLPKGPEETLTDALAPHIEEVRPLLRLLLDRALYPPDLGQRTSVPLGE